MPKRDYQIYAVDFDGTLCANALLINHLIKRRNEGNKIILWTCRMEQKRNEAVEWCRSHGLEFDAINENLPEILKEWGESRKIFADVYIDDKAKNKPAYHVPFVSEVTLNEC